MLEVKNLVKDYRPKKGKPVRAIDGISIKFPEKGMVFILGKSGSGKSTLLNLLGGLDTYDSGEIIIKGKSSKDFKQSEFDSYRNTYLGFIFQEYNILKDFNVAQNIALALQLQGQKATDEKINEILKEVDLEGYGGRKTSELSGGQKQRVAIARALVKNPEIIMADEPTGALDSKTGLQVFDTLKKLSENKLVITITHDRDFAEMYGDRVIELKDGKIISDIEKYSAEAEKISEGIRVTDNKIITVQKGYTLTENDLEKINDYLKEHDMIISVDEKANGDLRRFARIKEDGKKESFKDTDESKIVVSDEKKFKLIKSRLPIKNKIKIGASSLKNKPVRLIFTIFLSMVAFTMFGLTDTFAAYNKQKATENSIIGSDINTASFSVKKGEKKYDDDYYYTVSEKLSEKDIKALQEKIGVDFLPVYKNDGYVEISSYLEKSIESNYYMNYDFGGILEADEAYINRQNFTIKGTYPQNEKEVAISGFYYDLFKKQGYKYEDTVIKPEEIVSETAFLSKKPYFKIGEEKITITAIIDTEFDKSRYEWLENENMESFDILDYLNVRELEETLKFGFHGLLFVKKGFIKERENSANQYMSFSLYGDSSYFYFSKKKTEQEAKNEYTIFYKDQGKTSLGSNEILIPIETAFEYIINRKEMKGEDTEQLNQIKNNLYAYRYNRQYEEYDFEYDVIKTDEAYFAYLESHVLPVIRENEDYFSQNVYYNFDSNGYYDSGDTAIVGYFIDPTIPVDGTVVLSGSFLEKTDRYKDDIYAFALYGNPTKEEWKKIIKFHYENEGENELVFSLRNGVIETLSGVNDIIESLSKIFLYIGIGFAVFAALMLTNFISTSIVFKRREIGILRAVGARGSDVYGIFAIESVIIALINFVLSTIASGVVIGVLGAYFRKEYHLSINVLSFGIRQIALIFGVAIVVALIASFLPTFRISRQRPVDAIKK